METLIGRVKGIMLQPRDTWREVESEFTKPGEIWVKHVLPLALIGPLAVTVGWIVFGKPVPLTSLTNPVTISEAVARGVLELVLSLVAVFGLSIALSVLAPSFGGQRNDVQALKAVAYSFTSAWLGGVFAIHAALWPAKWVFYVYTFVLLLLGLPVMMKIRPDQATAYAAVGTIVGIVVFLITRAVLPA